jgi:hypothetical protein
MGVMITVAGSLFVAMVILFVSPDNPQPRKAKQFVDCNYTRNDLSYL